jgi:hypothetical protein
MRVLACPMMVCGELAMMVSVQYRRGSTLIMATVRERPRASEHVQ